MVGCEKSDLTWYVPLLNHVIKTDETNKLLVEETTSCYQGNCEITNDA